MQFLESNSVSPYNFTGIFNVFSWVRWAWPKQRYYDGSKERCRYSSINFVQQLQHYLLKPHKDWKKGSKNFGPFVQVTNGKLEIFKIFINWTKLASLPLPFFQIINKKFTKQKLIRFGIRSGFLLGSGQHSTTYLLEKCLVDPNKIVWDSNIWWRSFHMAYMCNSKLARTVWLTSLHQCLCITKANSLGYTSCMWCTLHEWA